MDKILTLKEKILLFIEQNDIRKVDFYEATGISSGNFKGKNLTSQIGGDALVKILTIYPNLSAEWLLRGEGTMTRGVGDATVPAASPAVPEPSSPAIVSDLVSKIAEQAEEIGQLKERIFQLERKKGKGVSDALTSGGASAG